MLPRSRLTELAENMVRHPRVLNYCSPRVRSPLWNYLDELAADFGGWVAVALFAVAFALACLTLIAHGLSELFFGLGASFAFALANALRRFNTLSK